MDLTYQSDSGIIINSTTECSDFALDSILEIETGAFHDDIQFSRDRYKSLLAQSDFILFFAGKKGDKKPFANIIITNDFSDDSITLIAIE